jgi:hypothetical protein
VETGKVLLAVKTRILAPGRQDVRSPLRGLIAHRERIQTAEKLCTLLPGAKFARVDEHAFAIANHCVAAAVERG